MSTALLPFSLAPGLDAFPVVHGKAPFAMALRRLLWEKRYASLALAFPASLEEAALEAVERLPEIHAAAVRVDGALRAYMPADPGDAYVEAMRQARQKRIPIRFLEDDAQLEGPRRHVLPDANLLPSLGLEGFRAWAERDWHAQADAEELAQAHRRARVVRAALGGVVPGPALLVCDFPVFFALEKAGAGATTAQEPDEEAGGEAPSRVEAQVFALRPGHLYFALGELPYYAGELEKERLDPLAVPRPYFDLVKSLFLGTRAALGRDEPGAKAASIQKAQTALTFARNLSALRGRITPGLLDLVAAARGVFGHDFGARLLETARRYPFAESQPEEGWMDLGRNAVRVPGDPDPHPAFNLFDDEPKEWKTLRLRRDPDRREQRRYRYQWDASGLCSHVPEDVRIERFNRAARARGRELLFQGPQRSEPLTASLKDGIDVRETLRNFAASGKIHVRETPPVRGQVDTVVVLFDTENDARYPFRMAWSFEHQEESMLTFYATEPFDRMAGPGIAQAQFGGLSLLFPPRLVPDVFRLPAEEFGFRNLAEQLVYGALIHSRQKSVVLVAAARPGARLRKMASGLRKRLVFIPLAAFSAETLRRLRRFHVLNGHKVRAWASRFIPE